MKVKVQVVTITDDGQESMREVACVERAGPDPRDARPLARGRQSGAPGPPRSGGGVADAGVSPAATHCPQCGKLRHSKGAHHTVFRTVFGALPVESPRLTHCRMSAP